MNEFVHVEPLAGRDGDAIGDFVEQVEFFNGNCVDLVEDVEGWDVNPEYDRIKSIKTKRVD